MDNLRYIIKTEKEIAERLGITIEEAKEKIRTCNFLEYQELIEANVDKSTQHTTPQQDSFKSNITTSTDANDTTPTKGHKVTISMDDGSTNELMFHSNRGDELEYKDSAGKSYILKPDDDQSALGKVYKKYKDVKSTATKLGGDFMAGVRKGMGESEDLVRLRELAGIKETTTSGAIASAPSIIGDTSDSHKPSVQLRKRLRLEREKKEKDKAREKKADKAKD